MNIMRFVNDFATGREVILREFPQFASSELIGDDSGWDNYAIKVDDTYLFRFPRRQASLNQIQEEIEVLNALRPNLPRSVQVPNYLVTNLASDYPFVYYQMIPGEPLTRDLYAKFTAAEKSRFIENLVTFLSTLHQIDPARCPSLARIDAPAKYRDLYRQAIDICFKYLTPPEQAKTRDLFEHYLADPSLQTYTPTIVHGDLSENHILITEDGIGIIDFGDVDIFDPAIDLSWFYLFDRDLFQTILTKYYGHDDLDAKRRIGEFYVPIIPYYGIIFGEESGDQAMIADELRDLRYNLTK